MHEQGELQSIPVKVYRTSDRLMVAAPLAGLEPEDITVVVTSAGRLVLDGTLRGILRTSRRSWSTSGAWAATIASSICPSRSMLSAPT